MRRHGDHPVHVLPAARRARARPDPGRDHLRARPASRWSSRRSRPCSTLEWAEGVTWEDVYRENERQWSHYNFEDGDVEVLLAPLRRLRGGVQAPDRAGAAAAGVRLRARSARTRSTCSTRAARSPSPSAPRTSAACATSRAPSPSSTSSSSSRRRNVPTLLFEIGCEELPAAACIEAEAAAARARARAARRRSRRSCYIGPRRLAFPARAASDRDARTRGSRARPRTCATGGRRVREALRRRRSTTLSVRDGFLGLEVPGQPIDEVLPERLAAIVARPPVHEVDDVGRRLPLRAARSGGSARSSTTRRSRYALEGVPSGGSSYRAPRRRIRARSRSPSAESYLEALRAAGVEPDRAVRFERDRRRRSTRSAGGATRSASSTRSCTSSRRRDVLDGDVRRALPRAARARDRDDDAVAPALLPARRQPLRVRRERRRPGRRARRATSSCSRAGSTTPSSRSSATSPSGSTGSPSARRRSRSSPAPARSPTRPTACVELVVELGGDDAARARRPGSRRPTRRPSSCASSPSSKGTSARRTRGSPATPTTVVPAIDEQYLPDSAGGAAARDRAPARCSPPPTSSTRCDVAFALGKRPTGSRDPFGAASRRDRPAAGSRPRAACAVERVAAAGRRARVRRGAARGPARRAGRVRPRRARVGRGRISAASRGWPKALHAARAERRVRGGVRGIRPGAAGSPASATTRPRRSTPTLLEHDTERELAARGRRARARPERRPRRRCSAQPRSRRSSRGFFDDVMVMADDDAVRAQPAAPAARRPRPARAARRPLADPAVAVQSRARRRSTRAARRARSRRGRARRSCSSAGSTHMSFGFLVP